VAAALAGSGLPADRLELEITESVLLKHTDTTLATLNKLRSLGVRIALDDFGIGYSSLSYLRRFRFDNIKIDQSFIAGIPARDDALFIVRAIVELCRNLGMGTTVEGVETAEQLAVLRAEGCDYAQGHFFAKPQPADHLGRLLDGFRPVAASACGAPMTIALGSA
jgi:EAL domain-containing protein (putative c-di-GMP-specific phosphodiesterase class I)